MYRFLFFYLLLTIGIFYSCNDDEGDTQILHGIYTETHPSPGTHQFIFRNWNLLTIKAKNSTDQEYKYKLKSDTITLIPSWSPDSEWNMEINIINVNKFEITNFFYPSIPEDPDPLRYVTFEK